MRRDRRLLLLAALSQGAAMATLFSALGEPGPLFLLVAGLLLVNLLITVGRRLPEGAARVRLVGAGLFMVAGLGIWAMVEEFPSLWTFLVTVGLGYWLWSRMQSLAAGHPRQLRNQLLNEGKLDLVLFLLALGLAALYSQQVDVGGEVVPLLLLFFWTRLFALMQTTRSMTAGEVSRGLIVKEGMPFLFVTGVLLFLLWSLPFTAPLWRTVAGWANWGLIWIFYGVGVLLEPLANWSGWREGWERYFSKMEPAEPESLSDEWQTVSGGSWIDPDILYLLFTLAALAALILWLRRRWIRRSRIASESETAGEVRQFIRTDRRKPTHPPAPEGAPTWMRRQYRLFLGRMWEQGRIRQAGETPVEFARRVGEEKPELRESAGELTAYYMEERYGDLPVESRRRRTTQLLESLKGR